MTLLSGIRVLDLSLQLPGPFCTMMMADYGADVVKIDEPSPRVRNPFAAEEPGTGPVDRYLNRGKRSVTINLKSGRGEGDLPAPRRNRRRRRRRVPARRRSAARDRLRCGLRGQPEDRLLLHLGVRPGRPDAGRPGPRRQLLVLRGGVGAVREERRRPDASSGATGGRVRRLHDGPLRDPHGAPRAGADRQGQAGGRLDDGRGHGLPRVAGGFVSRRRHAAGARLPAVDGDVPVLRGVPVRGRRLPQRRGARSLVLEGAHLRAGARGPGREAVRDRCGGGKRQGRAASRVPHPPPRRVDEAACRDRRLRLSRSGPPGGAASSEHGVAPHGPRRGVSSRGNGPPARDADQDRRGPGGASPGPAARRTRRRNPLGARVHGRSGSPTCARRA